MANLRLLIGVRAQGAGGQVPLTFTGPTGAETQGSLDPAQLTGAWTADEVSKKLNDPVNRQHAEKLGKGLFERLFPAGSAMRQAWQALSAADRQLPLELQIDDEDLRGYPWELLWDAADRKHARVGGLVRRAVTEPAQLPNSEWPFRILIIVGVDDATLPAAERIGARQEVDLLKETLSNFGRSNDVLLLPVPTREAVQKTLAGYLPHVIHFIGHGTYDQGEEKHAVEIQNPASTWNWNTSQIEEDLSLAKCTPRLVFLNSCRSASERDSSLSLQKALSNMGVPVVVAMQADVRGDKAADFGKAFYEHALVGPKPTGPLPAVIDAVREGRRKLGTEADVDWALPTLTFGKDVPVDYVLRVRPQWPNDPNFLRCREFDDARVYADSTEARRTMIQWFYPVKPGREPNILILRGPAGSGKTRLLHWCMESWAAATPSLRYLRVDVPRGENCVQWLIRLRVGGLSKDRPDEDRFLKNALDLQPFLPFYDAVAKAANLTAGVGKVDDVADARIGLIDTFQKKVTDEVAVGPLCEAFLEGLQQIGRIVLVFDQLSVNGIDPQLFAGFRDAFLVPVTAPTQENVRVVLALTRDDYDRFGLKGLDEQAASVVDLKADHTSGELEELAVEALRYRNKEDLRLMATRFLRLQSNKRTGLGRLEFCQQFLEFPDFQNLKRMR
jgi:hypothetical protein